MGNLPGLTARQPQIPAGHLTTGGGKPGTRLDWLARWGPGAGGGWLLLVLGLMTGGGAAGVAWELSPSVPYAASGFAQGPFTPSSATYRLTNTGQVALAWSSMRDQSWFSAQPNEGVLPPGEGTNVTVFPNTRALELGPGRYQGTLSLTNLDGAGGGEVPVELEIGVPGPASLDFVQVQLTNQLQLQVTGLPGTTVVVEASTNFMDWTAISTNTLESKRFAVPLDLAEHPTRFFRSLSTDLDAVPSRLFLTNVFVENLQRVELTGDAGGTYLVETSPDGLAWTPVSTNKVPASGGLIFTNTITFDQTNLTYRVQALDSFSGPPLHQVLIVGQSLAAGVGGAPALSTDPSEFHYRYSSDGISSLFFHLVEISLETLVSGLAAHVTQADPDHAMIFSNVSQAGAVYQLLKRGTETYARGITQFRHAPQHAAFFLRSVVPTAIFAVHGEGDHVNPDYGRDIRQWQEDYERDIRNVTGLEVAVPMFHSQASAWTSPGNGSNVFTLGAFLVLEESEANPARTILVGPKYQFTYADGIHLTNTSYRWLGEYYAKAYRRTVLEGVPWQPLKPLQVTRAGTVVTAEFHVPVPPLVLDTNLVSDPGRFGFEYHDNSGLPPEVVSVEVVGPNLVQLTLSAEPAGGGERLRYAFRGVAGNSGGPLTGPRGNLRDSDDEASLYGNTLYNWCVHFDKPVSAGK